MIILLWSHSGLLHITTVIGRTVHSLLLFFTGKVNGITINDARLTGEYQGTVEVLTHLGWLPVCSMTSNYWGNNQESRVLCRQFGYVVTGMKYHAFDIMLAEMVNVDGVCLR